jgi:hypothetical protein
MKFKEATILKKDKRYNSQIDNYTNKYGDTFKLGLMYLAIFLVGCTLYNLYKYLL